MAYIDPHKVAEVKKMDLLTYLKYYEPEELVHHHGAVYTTRTHDSLKISNGMWTWWSRGIGGRSALDYLIKVKGYKFVEAVEQLVRCMRKDAHIFLQKSEVRKKEKRLILPEKGENTDKVIAYLKDRGVSEDIIADCIEKKLIYQDKQSGAAVFAGYDTCGNARYAAHRATDGSRRMGDCCGSDKSFSFRLVCEKSNTVHVFESAIDLLSFMSLAKMDGKEYQRTNYLSLSGVYSAGREAEYKLPAALENFLAANSNICNICLHLDNDKAGREAANGIVKALQGKFNVYDAPPPAGKDYNDYLISMLQNREENMRRENKEYER